MKLSLSFLILLLAFRLVGQSPSASVKLPPFVNQAGYNLGESKRFVCYGAPDNTSFKVVSHTKGEWLVKVKTTEAGGPYIVKVSSSKESVVIQNILLGEVWLCSGQSNMEMPVLGFNNQPVNGSVDALFDADNDNIRLFKLKANASETPQSYLH
jgi:hypothetical protein